MQRYIIAERTGVEGLRLEKNAEVPQLKGPNDVSLPRYFRRLQEID
jgi:hypothetical protein